MHHSIDTWTNTQHVISNQKELVFERKEVWKDGKKGEQQNGDQLADMLRKIVREVEFGSVGLENQ